MSYPLDDDFAHMNENQSVTKRNRLMELEQLAPEQQSDPAGARALWQLVDREVTDAALWVPLIATKDVNFLSKRVGNYQFSPDGMGLLIDQLWVR